MRKKLTIEEFNNIKFELKKFFLINASRHGSEVASKIFLEE